MPRHKPESWEVSDLTIWLIAEGLKKCVYKKRLFKMQWDTAYSRKKNTRQQPRQKFGYSAQKGAEFKTCLPFLGPKANQRQETTVCACVRGIELHQLSEGRVISRALLKNWSTEPSNYSIAFCRIEFRDVWQASASTALTGLCYPQNQDLLSHQPAPGALLCTTSVYRNIFAGTIPERIGSSTYHSTVMMNKTRGGSLFNWCRHKWIVI